MSKPLQAKTHLVRLKVSNKLRLSKIELETGSKYELQNCKVLDSIDNLKDMSLNTSTPKFRTIRQTPSQKLNSRPSFYIVKRRKLQQNSSCSKFSFSN